MVGTEAFGSSRATITTAIANTDGGTSANHPSTAYGARTPAGVPRSAATAAATVSGTTTPRSSSRIDQ